MNEQRNFPYRPSSVAEARHFAAHALNELPEAVVESATLIVSELATNSIRHARTGFTLTVERDRAFTRISIVDLGDGVPVLKSSGATELSGRGLHIVDLLADEWGVIPSTPERGKTVWFSLRVNDPNRPLEDAP